MVTAETINSEAARMKLITRLIQLATDQVQFDGLINLLKTWPLFQNIEDTESKPLDIILTRMIKRNKSIVQSVLTLKEMSFLDDQDVECIRTQLEEDEGNWTHLDGRSKIGYLKLLLAYKNEKMLKNFIRFTADEMLDENLNYERLDTESGQVKTILDDKELMQLILKDEMYVILVNTPFYLLFMHYILNEESKGVIYDVVRCLKKQELVVEAAKLFGQLENFCESYRSLSNCLSLLDNFD